MSDRHAAADSSRTRDEFTRMVRSREFATIEEVARTAGLARLAEDARPVEQVAARPEPGRADLPTRS